MRQDIWWIGFLELLCCNAPFFFFFFPFSLNMFIPHVHRLEIGSSVVLWGYRASRLIFMLVGFEHFTVVLGGNAGVC